MDVLAPKIGEIIGGSQREERFEVLERRIQRAESRRFVVVSGFASLWYCPHAGLARV